MYIYIYIYIYIYLYIYISKTRHLTRHLVFEIHIPREVFVQTV